MAGNFLQKFSYYPVLKKSYAFLMTGRIGGKAIPQRQLFINSLPLTLNKLKILHLLHQNFGNRL